MTDITNCQMVAADKTGIIILNPPIKSMAKQEALVFAAWIVALAETEDGQFNKILEQVMNT